MPLVPMISQLTELRQPFAFHACSNAALLCPDLLLRGLLEQAEQDGVVPLLVNVEVGNSVERRSVHGEVRLRELRQGVLVNMQRLCTVRTALRDMIKAP